MSKRLLLYGATGYSGRLIAAEALRRLNAGSRAIDEVVLGGRDRIALADMRKQLGLRYIVFSLDDHRTVEAALRTFDVMLNAAGPFARTATQLTKSAIAAGCHYVDINGEVDVCQALDDLGRLAADRGVKMVSGAGYTATVSDVLLEWALRRLVESQVREVGDVRLAFTALTDMSRGSALTALRLIREQVITVRGGTYVHVPVGKLERSFDFHAATRTATANPPEPRIASAANLLDTLTAFQTISRHRITVAGSIVSYIAMPRPVRLGYQLGALSAVFLQLPLVQQLIRLQLGQLPEGPDAEERAEIRQHVVLQIESIFSEPLVDWCLETPSSYDLTGPCALAVAEAVARGGGALGWNTPAQVLNLPLPEVVVLDPRQPVRLAGPLHDCVLDGRPVPVRP